MKKFQKDLKYNVCKTQIQNWVDTPYNYELTTTINPNIYCLTKVACDEAESTFYEKCEDYIVKNKIDLETITIVKEYQKNRYPHWHCLLNCNTEIPPKIRQSFIGGMNQNVGKTSFKNVADLGAFQQYLSKELESNYEKTKEKHYEIINYEI